MVERLHADALGQRLIRNHQVQPMQSQLGNEVWELSLAANQTHRFSDRQRRLKQPISHRLGHRVRHAHPKLQRAHARLGVSHGGLELGAQGKDVVGIAQGFSAVLGQLKLTAAFAKQLAAQAFF